MKNFNQPDTKLFFKKNDPLDPRLGEAVVTKISPQKGDFVILGYPDDEGVALNGGRVGAHEGPDSIRSVFYKMTPAYNNEIKYRFIDMGNVDCTLDIIKRHEAAKQGILYVLESEACAITLGGGHDYGYGDFSAFCEWSKKNKKIPYILNFDAHLDVRPDTHGPHSGTAFYKLLNNYPDICFYEIGIQSWCNSKFHGDWLKKRGGHIITLDEIIKDSEGLEGLLYKKVLKNFNSKKHSLAISVDIDGFASSACPGASQVFPLGLSVEDFYRTWASKLIPQFKPRLMGIYEVNPKYDLDQRTAKFAAILMHSFIFKR